MASGTTSRHCRPGPAPTWGNIALTLAWTLIAAQLASPAARADDAAAAPASRRDDSDARRLYDEGLTFYRRGQYDQAITKLGQSYDRSHAPDLLYDLAQAHRQKGDCAAALDLYRRYLASGPAEAARDRTRALIAKTERCAVVPPPKEEAPAGALRTAPSSLLAPPPATTPSPLIGARAAGPAAAATTKHGTLRRRVALATGLASIALASLTGYFAWRTSQASSAVSNDFKPGMQWNGTEADRERQGQLDERLELASGAGALLTGGVAAWFFLHD